MKVLAWDTSSKSGAIVALETEPFHLRGEFTLNVDSTQSEQLLWGIHHILEAAKWKLKEVDIFGVGIGPGSFTGLRIGITTARTLAHTMEKPLVPVSSLEALVQPVWESLTLCNLGPKRTLVVAATDACKGELFTLLGTTDPVSQTCENWEARVESPNDLMNRMKNILYKIPDCSWIGVGEGRKRYLDAWNLLPSSSEIKIFSPYADVVQGRHVGTLVWQAFQAGRSRNALEVHPEYLRASDAEIKLKSGLLSPGSLRGRFE